MTNVKWILAPVVCLLMVGLSGCDDDETVHKLFPSDGDQSAWRVDTTTTITRTGAKVDTTVSMSCLYATLPNGWWGGVITVEKRVGFYEIVDNGRWSNNTITLSPAQARALASLIDRAEMRK
jgi:hypothetical protein